jgi:hypothetical protein
MDSSKIKKEIRSIIFISETLTLIQFKSNFTPAQHNQAVKEEIPLKSNMARHDDFNRAMEKFKVHLMVRSEFIDPVDRIGKPIEQSYFNDHIFEDDERLKGVKVKGVIFTTKEDTTSFQIIGSKVTTDGQIVPLKSPPISTIKLPEGVGVYNYPLLVLADEHKETIILEAQEFLKYKSNANTLFSSQNVNKPTPSEERKLQAV